MSSRDDGSSRTSRRALARILVLAASTLFAVGAVETYVRLAGLDRPLVWQPHPELGWWHIPHAATHWTEEGNGHVLINSHGLRDVERALTKPPGVFRIAVFGDSMTEGVQVDLEQTFTRLLEARLRRRGLSVEVLNFGVNGYSPLQEYLLYLHVGKAYQPDLVLQALFTDNDVADSHPDLATSQGGAPIVHRTTDGSLVVNNSPAVHSSADYRSEPIATLRRISATYRFLSAMRWARKQSAATGQSGVQRRYLLYTQPSTSSWEEAWVRFEFVVDAFDREVKSAGSRFAAISVPAGQVTDERAWHDLLADVPAMRDMSWDVQAAENRLAQMMARRGIPLLSPLDEFRRRLDSGPLFFGRVGHFTPQGHTVMADRLADWLIGSGLVPSQTP